MKEILKVKEKGITLIALVITIIILLILAGVSIATLTGDNGILAQANNAKEKTELAEKDEKNDLANTEDIINKYANGIEVEQVTDENPGALETEGTDTYIINSIEDLVVFASDVTNGNTYEGKTVKLGLSLDFNSNKSYVDPLRTDYGQYGYEGELKSLLISEESFKIIQGEFVGNFDGKGKKIYNLYINIEDAEDSKSVGLLSINKGIIKNLELLNSNIRFVSKNYAITGSVVGSNYGIIDNCYSSR